MTSTYKIAFTGTVVITALTFAAALPTVLSTGKLDSSLLWILIGAFFVGIWQVVFGMALAVQSRNQPTLPGYMATRVYLLVVLLYFMSPVLINAIGIPSAYRTLQAPIIGIPTILYLFHFYLTFKYSRHA